MDRQHRRELKHDKFVDEVGSLTLKARENQKILFAITAGIVALALIAYGVYFYVSNKEQKAQLALAAAIEALDSPLIVPGANNPLAKFKTEEERATRTEAMFREVQTKYSGTDAADVAGIYVARLAGAKGDVAGARKLLEGFIAEHPDHMLVGGARYSLFQLRITNGEAAQVISEVNAELGKGVDTAVLPQDALLSLLGQAHEAQGDGTKARDAYRRIVTEFPDSAYALEAQRRFGASG